MDIPDYPIYLDLSSDMRRVFTNLIINSIKHNPGERKLEISIEDNTSIKVYFADNGPAITDEEKETIFDPFVKLDSSRKTGSGSGLGLAISKEIVEYNGGRIKIIDNYKNYTKAFVLSFNKQKNL